MWLPLVVGGAVMLFAGRALATTTPTTVETRLVAIARTRDAKVNRLVPLVVRSAVRTFGPKVDPKIVRALVGILWKESAGNPRWYLGDKDAPNGPSVGPMQAYRGTATWLKLWAPPPGATEEQARAAYAALANDEARTIDIAVREFAYYLGRSGGDIAEAVKRYNGSGAGAEEYRNKVLGFLATTWPGGRAVA